MISAHSEVVFAYDRYASQVRAFLAMRTSCPQTAEDLTQETYIRLHKQANKLATVKNLRAYVFRVAHNLLIDHYRAERARITSKNTIDIFEDCEVACDQPTAEETVERHEEIEGAMQAVAELSPLCQRIFWLSRWDGYRNHEIATMQRVCLSTVEKNISRASRLCQTLQ